MRKALPLLLLALPAPAMAQFDMRWSSIDAGGGFSSGGSYSLFGVSVSPTPA